MEKRNPYVRPESEWIELKWRPAENGGMGMTIAYSRADNMTTYVIAHSESRGVVALRVETVDPKIWPRPSKTLAEYDATYSENVTRGMVSGLEASARMAERVRRGFAPESGGR